MREERTEDIHINFRNEEEIQELIDALKFKWDEGCLDMKGVSLIVILENAIGKHETENYLMEVIQKPINID